MAQGRYEHRQRRRRRAAAGSTTAGIEPDSPFSPALIERLGGLLRDAGVDVLPDATVFQSGDASGAVGFAISEFQLRNMAAEIGGDVGGGFFGTQLDEIAPMPAGAPPISYFVAAWMVRASTPAAKAAADLMGPRDFTHAPQLVYPTVVLAAFVGEAVRASAQEPAAQPAVFERF